MESRLFDSRRVEHMRFQFFFKDVRTKVSIKLNVTVNVTEKV